MNMRWYNLKQVFNWIPSGRRKRRKPKPTWKYGILSSRLHLLPFSSFLPSFSLSLPDVLCVWSYQLHLAVRDPFEKVTFSTVFIRLSPSRGFPRRNVSARKTMTSPRFHFIVTLIISQAGVTNVKLWASDHWLGTWRRAYGTATLTYSFLDAVHDSMDSRTYAECDTAIYSDNSVLIT